MISLDYLKSLPTSPGVYIYKDITGSVIYVGKAINLKRRVTSYFKRDDALGPKTATLVANIANIEYRMVSSEVEALILEATLIKKYRPKYNSLLKDDKSYSYICFSRDEFPIIYSARKSNLDDCKFYYGPFPDGSAVRNLLRTIRKIFPYYTGRHFHSQPCLYCHIGLCPGPDLTKAEYAAVISKIRRFLRGNFNGLTRLLTKEMKLVSDSQDYEKAKLLRNQIDSIKYITSVWRNINIMFADTNLSDDQMDSARRDLATILAPHYLIKNINRLECFDISNLGSNYFVGSMVVFQNNNLDKDEYRKFKIYSKFTPDDQYMIREVVWRRLKHPEWPYPDLLVVDGGKPQVASVHQIFAQWLELPHIPVIGLAKKEETIVIKTTDDWVEIKLPRNSSALQLLQRLRDEAHRFANSYRRQLVSKSLYES